MAVENPSYINELNQNWPDGLDPKSQGDDHLRNIKKALKQTFPNVTGPVTMTQSQLNQLGTPGVVNFPGMIVMWTGTVANIPAGWKVCNGTGTISTGAAVPNLQDRFIVGAGNTYPVTTTGGSNSATPSVTVQPTALTIDQIPAHYHIGPYGTGAGQAIPRYGVESATPNDSPATYPAQTSTGPKTSTVGGSQGHTHAVTVQPISTVPVYYAVLFIIKD